jgi:YVTN family beta-propeller protein
MAWSCMTRSTRGVATVRAKRTAGHRQRRNDDAGGNIVVLSTLSSTLRAFTVAALAVFTLASVSTRTYGAEESFEASTLPLQKVADVPLGGGTTRFDYESFDSSRHLLFIAHLGDSEVVAFNTEMSRVVGRVVNVSSVHGVLAIPELGRVYASATGANEAVAIDVATLGITARMPTGAYPDGMAYAPEAHKLYVSDETGGTVTVIDVRSNTRIASIQATPSMTRSRSTFSSTSRRGISRLKSTRSGTRLSPE